VSVPCRLVITERYGEELGRAAARGLDGELLELVRSAPGLSVSRLLGRFSAQRRWSRHRALGRVGLKRVLTTLALPGGISDRPSAYGYHMAPVGRTQTLVQLSDDLLAQLDARMVREGRSRSELIREALAVYLGADREAEIDRQIVEAYTRQPQEDLGAKWAARASIAAENWDEP
jgi:Arc/MetJ-type ribon-helix-helix transcriptional regulator